MHGRELSSSTRLHDADGGFCYGYRKTARTFSDTYLREFGILEITRTGLPAVNWTTNGVWIGLSDGRFSGIFEWTDETQVNYTLWGPSRPHPDSFVSYAFFFPDYFVDTDLLGYYDHWDNCVPATREDPVCKVRGAVCKKDSLR